MPALVAGISFPSSHTALSRSLEQITRSAGADHWKHNKKVAVFVLCSLIRGVVHTPLVTPEHYQHQRFPTEIIRHRVWLYYRFCLSYRDVEELLVVRGVLVSYEAIRQWGQKFGQA